MEVEMVVVVEFNETSVPGRADLVAQDLVLEALARMVERDGGPTRYATFRRERDRGRPVIGLKLRAGARLVKTPAETVAPADF